MDRDWSNTHERKVQRKLTVVQFLEVSSVWSIGFGCEMKTESST